LGPPRSITPTIFDALEELLLGKPDRQLDELAAFLREEFDVEVSTPTISRTLKVEGWSKKMIRCKAKEQNADLREKYLHELSFYHFIYITSLYRKRNTTQAGPILRSTYSEHRASV
jgi:hypothetical protein